MINVALAILVYFALFVGVENAMAVLTFYVWATFVVVVLGLLVQGTDEFEESESKKIGERVRTLPRWFCFVWAVGMCCVLVWFGHYVLGSVYAISSFFADGILSRIEKVRCL